VHLVGPGAARTLARSTERYPFLAQVCRVSPNEGDLAALLRQGCFGGVPDRVFLCDDDEEQALRAALTIRELWRGGTRSVLVRLERLSSLAEAFDGRSGDRLLDEVSGTLHLYRVVRPPVTRR